MAQSARSNEAYLEKKKVQGFNDALATPKHQIKKEIKMKLLEKHVHFRSIRFNSPFLDPGGKWYCGG